MISPRAKLRQYEFIKEDEKFTALLRNGRVVLDGIDAIESTISGANFKVRLKRCSVAIPIVNPNPTKIEQEIIIAMVNFNMGMRLKARHPL